MAYRFWHHRTREIADVILKAGFKNAKGTYLTVNEYEGMWISDDPLDVNEGADGDTYLEILLDLPDDVLAQYEWVEIRKPYREWLIKADLLNQHGATRIVSDEQLEAYYRDRDIEQSTEFSEANRKFRIYRKCEGPTNPPLHVPGKWYWCPYDREDDLKTSWEENPYCKPYESAAEAEAAVRSWCAARVK